MADPTARDGEIIRLRNRTRALEAELEQAEAKLHTAREARAARAEFTFEVRAERDALKAAVERVCGRLDWLIANGFGARTDTLCDLLAALNPPGSPATAPTPVTAATEAHGGAGEAQEGSQWAR